ncbi:MAG: hypothetical protein JWP57_1834 [Spirosoma sp.]|nr:hypothetical protein [Spirosoma sp.]
MKFKVKDVASATYAVEKITSQFGGFVTYTNLKSTIDNVETSIVSADSSLERTYYTVVNEVTIRVPNTRLDTTLKSIATLIDYLDYRVIRADDAALTLLANKLTQSRAAYTEQRIVNAIDARGNKLAETTTAEELLSGKQEQADNATLANRSLQDQIRFSTITLALYQRQTIRRELVASYPPIDAYKPGFATRMGDSMKYGWGILEDVLVFIVRLWGLLLLAIVAYYGYRRYGYKIKSKPIT